MKNAPATTLLVPLLLLLLASGTAQAASQIYFGSSGFGGGLFRMNLDGTARVAHKPADGTFYGGVAVDPVHGHVYQSATSGMVLIPGITRTTLLGEDDSVIVPDVFASYIAVDGAHDKLCWVEFSAVRCAHLDGSNITTVADFGGSMTFGVGQAAIDLDTGELYWTRFDTGNNLLQVFNEAGGMPVLQNACLSTPLVAIDHVARKLYSGCDRAFRVSDLDGATPVALPLLPVGDRGLSVDPFGRKLYTDSGFGSLHRMDLDGTNLEQISDLGSNGGTALYLEQLASSSCTVTDNGTTATISCPDGTTVTIDDGADGLDGVDGVDGTSGADGVDGASGTDGVDGANGADGAGGAPGIDGADGASCTVTDNDDGTATITCPDGSEATVGTAAADSGCASAPAAPVGLVALLGLRRRRRR